eukprot:m.286275 g.286275  ORF g.286275 m.286275 type:complete len:1080 (+) comp15779_c0_seq1:241-3480(+)
MEYDRVIVVGGGLAGHAAAHAALENGARVLLLDKSMFCGGNSTKATSGINGAGTRAQKANGIPDTPATFETDTLKSAGNLARPHLVRALTHMSAPAVEWLSDRFDLQLPLVGQLGAHSFPRTHRGTERFPGMMITYGLSSAYETVCENEPDRAQLITKANVTQLIKSGSQIVGVKYSKGGKTYEARGAVIIATGGFGADFSESSLLKKVESSWRQLPMWKGIPNLPSLLSLPTTNGSHTTGDGIKMAIAVGAGTVDLPYVQVHPTGLVDPKDPSAKVKWLAAEALRGSGAIMLNAHGKRFANELGKRDYVTSRMFQSKGPFRLILNGKQSKEFEWHCEHYEGRGVMKHFASGAALAAEMGISPATLKGTFDRYNSDAASNQDPFGKAFFRNLPYIMDDQFYVAEVTPVVHYTMGGISADEKAQVLTPTHVPIKGLFAAGEVIGGIHGDNRLGGSSLLDCVVFGRLAGTSAAELVGKSTQVPQQSASKASTSTKTSTAKDSSATLKEYTMDEVAAHTSKTDCWVVLHGKVYDLTSFLEDHPGGAASIMAYAGKDASKQFDMLHAADIIPKYADDYLVGVVAGQGSTTALTPGGLTMAEVAKHNTSKDCWIVIHGKAYDLTTFLNDHPAGANILLKYAGQDGTAAFDASGHPKDIVSQLGLDHLCLGDVTDAPTVEATAPQSPSKDIQKPPLSQILNLFDFEAVARQCLSQQGWAYYSSGADDEICLRENHAVFHRLWLRPRILVNVADIDLSSSMLGYSTTLPIYISSCALGRLAHPDGEMVLARAAGTYGVIQLCPTLASCTLEEMTGARVDDGQTQFLQLYVNHDRKVSERLIRRAEAHGIKALFVTVDAPQLGRREKDMRVKFTMEAPDVQQADDKEGSVDRNQGTARAISQFIDPSLSWKDIEWLRSVTKMPIVLKGVQCAEDAILAAERGLDGIVLSNHGGRQLDFARSSVEVLVEVTNALKQQGLQDKLEIYVDGGFRRGSDVLKALCLGAKAVGLGRPSLYAMAGYGQEGVEHMFQILKDEMIMCMRLMGAPSLKHLVPQMVCTRSIESHITPVPTDSLTAYVYEPLQTQSKL